MSKPVPLNWLASLHDKIDTETGILRVWLVWTRWQEPNAEQREELFLDHDDAVACLCHMVDELSNEDDIKLDDAQRIRLAALSGKQKISYFFNDVQDKVRGDVTSVGIYLPRLQ